MKELTQTHTATDSRDTPLATPLPNPAGGSCAARLFQLTLACLPPEHPEGSYLNSEIRNMVTKTWVLRFRKMEKRELFLSMIQNPENIREKMDRPEHIFFF